MSVWIFVALVFLLGVVYFMSTRRADKQMAERFAGRQPVEFDEFYEQYYASILDRELVRELVEHVAHELSIPTNKLRPDDRFEFELKPLAGWEFDSGQNMLFIEIERLARERGKEVDLKAIRTLDDYIKVMAKLYY